MAASPVCWSGRDEGSISAHAWALVVAARRIAGRPLEHPEMQSIVESDRRSP